MIGYRLSKFLKLANFLKDEFLIMVKYRFYFLFFDGFLVIFKDFYLPPVRLSFPLALPDTSNDNDVTFSANYVTSYCPCVASDWPVLYGPTYFHITNALKLFFRPKGKLTSGWLQSWIDGSQQSPILVSISSSRCRKRSIKHL